MSLFGWGDAYLKTKNVLTNLGDSPILVFEGSALALEQSASEIEAKSFQKGVLKTKRSGIGETQYTVTMATQFANWQHLSFVLDEMPSDSTGISVPVLKYGIVPVTGAPEITDAGITAGNLANVKVQVTERSEAWGEARYLTADKAVVAAGKITLDPEFAGAPIAYTLPVAYADTVQTLGVNANADRYGSLELWFKVYGDTDYPQGLWFNFPLLTRKGLPNINFSDSPATFEMKFGAGVPSGQNTPYRIINPATVTT